jgi:hypothetical protein
VTRLALLVFVPPILAVETVCAYADALRRNSPTPRTTLVGVPDEGLDLLLPVCSCCRMRALRPAGSGRICPDCDCPEPRHVHPSDSRPPTDGTSGGV